MKRTKAKAKGRAKAGQRTTRGRGRPVRRVDARARGQAVRVFEILRETYPEAKCALEHRDAFELLVATVLSAQCTDARVNKVTPALFATYPTPEAMAAAPIEALEQLVRTTGFFRNKSKNLSGAAKRLTEVYGGKVPSAMEDLLTLPGVARKTANVVRGTAYGLADGVVVDTHVHRLARRLGWSDGKTPEHVERDLMALFPKETWIDLAHLLIHHGRRLCTARKPKCEECPVSRLCPSSLV
jgi:endonuclease-3